MYICLSASSDLRVINRKIIIEGPQSQQVCLGCKAILQCILSDSSSDYTKVFWKKDNTDVEANERIEIDSFTNKLVINDAKVDDSGNNDTYLKFVDK